MTTKEERRKRVKREREQVASPQELKQGLKEVGTKGGETVAKERGREFYQEIGKKGGEKVAQEKGREFCREHPETDEQAMELARRERRAGKSPSTQAGHFVHEEIEHAKKGRHA